MIAQLCYLFKFPMRIVSRGKYRAIRSPKDKQQVADDLYLKNDCAQEQTSNVSDDLKHEQEVAREAGRAVTTH